MTKHLWKATLTVVAIALLGAAIAVAAGKPAHTTKSTTTGTTTRPSNGETPLTGATLTQATAAALAKTSGGSVDAATTETDGSLSGAAYEVHVTKTDGSHATVILDKAFAVLGVETGGPRGGHGNGETPLTGDTKTKAIAAALANTPGTAASASTETNNSNASAKYEVHVTKADGTHVSVILDASFAVLSVETAHAGGPGDGHGGRH
jgi:uncharacterized membrane protein YkoI